jgi:hypothetical protein
VTGGGQDFVYAEKDPRHPAREVVGTVLGTKFAYSKDGKPFLPRDPKLLLDDNNAGKPEGIHLMLRPSAPRSLRRLDRRPPSRHRGKTRSVYGRFVRMVRGAEPRLLTSATRDRRGSPAAMASAKPAAVADMVWSLLTVTRMPTVHRSSR